MTPRLPEVLPIPRHRAPSRPRHRAPSGHARPLTTAALTGITLGGTLLYPLAATASASEQHRLSVQRSGYDTHRTDYEDPDGADWDGADWDGADRDGADSDGADRDGADSDDTGRDYSDSDDSDDSDDSASTDRSVPDSASARPHASTRPHASARTAAQRPAARSIGRPAHPARHTRPMSSGELQYRNGCRQGYVVKDCGQFDVPHLLRRGINPYL